MIGERTVCMAPYVALGRSRQPLDAGGGLGGLENAFLLDGERHAGPQHRRQTTMAIAQALEAVDFRGPDTDQTPLRLLADGAITGPNPSFHASVDGLSVQNPLIDRALMAADATAARTVLHDWNSGKIKYYCRPPKATGGGEAGEGDSAILSSFSAGLDLDAMQASDVRVLQLS